MTAQHTAQLLFEHVWKHYGLPTTIIFDRYARFFNTFWKTLWKQLDTRLCLSTTFHPQRNEQTKVVNRLVVQLLRMYNHKHRQTLDDHLPYIQHSYNRYQHSSTRKSPFEICYEIQPSVPIDLISSSMLVYKFNSKSYETYISSTSPEFELFASPPSYCIFELLVPIFMTS